MQNYCCDDPTTDCQNINIVMQESHMRRISDQLGSTFLVDLILTPAEIQINTWKPDTTKIMQESQMPRVLDLIGSISLADFILTPAEIQRDTWKPDTIKITQLFQNFNNEGFDVSKLLFDIFQCSKLRYIQNKEIHLFVLKFTESMSVNNWASHNYFRTTTSTAQ